MASTRAEQGSPFNDNCGDSAFDYSRIKYLSRFNPAIHREVIEGHSPNVKRVRRGAPSFFTKRSSNGFMVRVDEPRVTYMVASGSPAHLLILETINEIRRGA